MNLGTTTMTGPVPTTAELETAAAGPGRKPFAFISYRRRESLPYARNLHTELESAFGRGSAFLDFESIPVGNEWAGEIDKALTKATVLIAVIGPRWLESFANDHAQATPDDWVRRELTYAIEHSLRVVPAAVAGADVPNEGQLPHGLQAIPNWQGFKLEDGRLWKPSVEVLLNDLAKSHRFRRAWKLQQVVVLVAFFAALLAASAGLAGRLGLNTLVTVPLAVLVFVAGTVSWSLLLPLIGMDQGPLLPRQYLWARDTLLLIVTLIISGSLIGLWSGLFLGVPAYVRDYLNPKHIPRTAVPHFPNPVIPEVFDLAFPPPSNAGQGAQPESNSSMYKMIEWLRSGARTGGARVYVYRFVPEKLDFYNPFTSSLQFPDLTDPKRGDLARLVDGIAFLERPDEQPRVWRQLRLWVDPKNPDRSPLAKNLVNELRDVRMDAGDTLLIILKFQPPANAAGLPRTKNDFRAVIAL